MDRKFMAGRSLLICRSSFYFVEAFQFRNVDHPIALLNSVLALLSRDLTVPAFT